MPIVVIPAAFIVIALVPLLGYAFLTRGKLAEEKLIAVAEMLDRNDRTPLVSGFCFFRFFFFLVFFV